MHSESISFRGKGTDLNTCMFTDIHRYTDTSKLTHVQSFTLDISQHVQPDIAKLTYFRNV